MKISGLFSTVGALVVGVCAVAVGQPPGNFQPGRPATEIDLAQVPDWSRADLEFFLHGSMSTEVVPEPVLQAFVATYPDLFPAKDLTNFGLLPDPVAGLPVGVSRRPVPHLGGLSSLGVNCASCHVGEIQFGADRPPLRVLGMTGQFDAEGFLGAVIVATFRTSDPANMQRYLGHYLAACDPSAGAKPQAWLAAEWQRQSGDIIAAIAADPLAAKDLPPGALHPIAPAEVHLTAQRLQAGADLVPVVRAQLKLFHNMRTAFHVPDQPPPPSPPNGPGRNDPWRILSYSLLGIVTKPAPVKFGIVWNEDQRGWVHVDGNTRSPIVRNLAAALGLGAPLLGHTGEVAFALLERHTALSQHIRPPHYPGPINRAAAGRGARIYQANCAACHDGPATDARLHAVAEIQTDPNRAEIFSPEVAGRFNQFFADLQIAGYRSPQPPPLRSTGQYFAPGLAGVWARSPYLHNGSVRTLRELLLPPGERPRHFQRGSRLYDPAALGYLDAGDYRLDTAQAGGSNAGHDFGTALAAAEKRELLEYLKTR